MKPLRLRLGERLLSGHAEPTAHLEPAQTGPCEAHPKQSYHRPPLKRTQWHHPVVRAWQRAWKPAQAIAPGVYQGEQLWDARGVYLGPTCHDVVHYWIVRIMRAVPSVVADHPTCSGQALAIAACDKALTAQQQQDPLVQMAIRSPMTFVAAGGELKFLADKGLWGDI